MPREDGKQVIPVYDPEETEQVPTTHDLKTWPEYFEPLQQGLKTFEFRKDDRPYAVGDVLILREWYKELYEDALADGSTPEEATEFAYSGRHCERRVTYIARGGLIPAGYVVMSVDNLTNRL